MIEYSPAARKSLKKLQRSDRSAYSVIQELIKKVPTGEGKVLTGSNELTGHRALRAGKLRVVYRIGPAPEVVYVGYRRDVYHTMCDN